MTKRRKKRRGRPAFKPTKRLREQVRTMAGMGLLPGEIAQVLGCSVSTLRKYCAEDLRTAAPKANAAVALALFKQATSTEKPNTVAGIFWLKCRAGWREADKQAEIDALRGKKEHRAAAARKVASSGKFRPSAPPRLAAVNGETIPAPSTKPEKP